MGEIKSVKVDNWGVFFLQKLQNFFNKTDYCDLTLQFNDNSQLKVHRLVLSACTDYFNVLEQTCEMMDDVLIMPLELQADVVVPIVNFMYTGTLEFELRMYGRLLKTARDMNMTVLLKLLEAHRRTMERSPTVQTLNRNNQRTSNYQRRTQTTTTRRGGHSNTTSYKSIQIKPIQSYFQASTTTQNITKYTTSTKPVKGPSRFDYPPEGKVLPPETFEQSFDTISYESKPLICKEEPDSEDYDGMVQKSSTFEELRRGYNNNKRPASSVSSFESPPEKKPNINDVKEFAEQQRVRKQIAQEFDDDNEFEETLDDEFHHDDDDDEYVPPSSYQKQSKQQQNKKSASNKEQQQQSVVIKQENNRQTIFVKDTQNSNVNHAKIISEVLRKYPHLVKNNKNIKLKIVPKSSGTGKSETQKIVLKTEVEQRPMAVPQLPPPSAKHNTYSSATHTQRTTGNIAAGKSLLQTKLPPKSSVTIKKVDVPTSATPSSSQQPRRIDSKTMHSLIAMGAENRTGPWLCLRCGVNGRPISIPSYRGFRRHLINAHQEKIDPRLCEHCGWRSTNNRELFHHMLVEHKIKPPTTYSFPKCDLCDTILLNYSDLEKHVAENHEEGVEVNQSCIYCNKTFANESLLYAHMKSKHRNRAKQDGVVDFSEDDEIAFESDSQLSQYHSDTGSDNKIKILSDISLPKNIPIIQAEDNAPGTTITLPTNIIQTDSKLIDPLEGPKFVNADGKEMELTDEQRQEIISQLQNQDHGAVVMVLNDDAEQLTSVLSGGDVSTSSPSTSVQATNVATPVAEKEQHKPRKTKHTVKTEIDDVGEGEEMIEWLDEESGNIMKVPLSKFSKMGDMEEEDEEGEEEMETEEETEEANKEVEAFENADDEEKSTKSKDIKSSDKIKKEINDDDDHNHKLVSADENTSDSVKDKKEDEKRKDSTSDHEIEEKDESTKSQQKSKTKSKIAENSAMETLKILTGDWSDDDDGEEEEEEEEEEDESIDKDNLKDVNNEISKDEEILFETLEERETNGESSDKLSKEDDNKIKSKDNEKKNIDKKKERKDSDMDLDNMSTDEQEDILKMNDIKVEDVTDDDMKIIEELKNYEQEQLEAAEAQAEAEAKAEVQAETAVEAEVETTAADETKDKSDIIAGGKELRSKAKSISKSASPTMSESSNSGSSNISATNTSGSDKPKRRGRPKKTPIIKEQKLDSQDKDDNDDGNDKVKEDDKKIETTEKKAEESKDDKRNKDKQIENDEDKDDENSKVSRKLSADEENSRSYVKSDDHEENKKSDDKDETDTDANATETTSQEPKNASDSVNKDNNDDLITKAEIRNLISDWGDDDDDDDDDL